MLEGLLAKLALGALWGRVKANVAHDWAAIPPKAKLALLGLLIAVAGYFVHQHYAHKALKAADRAGYERAKAEDATALAELRTKAQLATINGRAIATDTRSKNDATNSAIDRSADAISVRGPGAASCRRLSDPAVSAASSEHGAGSDHGPDHAAGNPVPAGDGQGDLAAVPWLWLVGWGRQADLDRAEVIAWREWYVRQSAEWQKLYGRQSARQ